jgi:hypothetical protein
MFPEMASLFSENEPDPREVERQRRILEKLERERNGNMPKSYPSKFNEGAQYMRDGIICSIVGMQNALHDWDDPKQKAYQEVMNMIIDNYGDVFKPCKL